MSETVGFPVIKSRVDLNQQQFQENTASWGAVLAEYEAALKSTSSEGKEDALSRHIGRGQLLGMSIASALPSSEKLSYQQPGTEFLFFSIKILHSLRSGRLQGTILRTRRHVQV